MHLEEVFVKTAIVDHCAAQGTAVGRQRLFNILVAHATHDGRVSRCLTIIAAA